MRRSCTPSRSGATVGTDDPNGSITTKGTTTLAWDVENRLTSFTDDNGTQTFAYGPDGQRLKRTRGGQTVHYPNRLYERNVTTGVVTTYYHLGGRLVALRKGTTLEYVQLDHLGSLTGSADSAGGQVASLTYAPWGKVVGWASSGTLGTEKKYTEQRDEDVAALVDLFYYGARYYEPGIGRFVSPDSLVPELTNPQALNRYGYVLNNPLRYTDPTGECWGPVSGFCHSVANLAVSAARNVGNALATETELEREGSHALAQGASQAADSIVTATQEIVGSDPAQFVLDYAVQNPTNVLNDALGLAIAATSGGDWDLRADAIVLENAGGLAGTFLDLVDASAFTVGHFVFAEDALLQDYASYRHELGHVAQYEIVGAGFLGLYAINEAIAQAVSTISGGYPRDYNVFEISADWDLWSWWP